MNLKNEVPVADKALLTLEEAASYFNIGMAKIRELIGNCLGKYIAVEDSTKPTYSVISPHNILEPDKHEIIGIGLDVKLMDYLYEMIAEKESSENQYRKSKTSYEKLLGMMDNNITKELFDELYESNNSNRIISKTTRKSDYSNLLIDSYDLQED